MRRLLLTIVLCLFPGLVLAGKPVVLTSNDIGNKLDNYFFTVYEKDEIVTNNGIMLEYFPEYNEIVIINHAGKIIGKHISEIEIKVNNIPIGIDNGKWCYGHNGKWVRF